MEKPECTQRDFQGTTMLSVAVTVDVERLADNEYKEKQADLGRRAALKYLLERG